ncbi:MAG: hypothetical protein ABJ327_21290 [Litoreibacter sp.]
MSQEALDILEGEGVLTKHVTRVTTRQMDINAIQNDANGERSCQDCRENSVVHQIFSHGTAAHLAAVEEHNLIYLSGT